MRLMISIVSLGVLLQLFAGKCLGVGSAPLAADWVGAAQRPEISPAFSIIPTGGHASAPRLVIASDGRPGLDGYWTKIFSIQGGRYYQFRAYRRIEGVENPRRSCLVTLSWLGADGRSVPDDRVVTSRYDDGAKPVAEMEHPTDRPSGPDGWTEVSEIYQAPKLATRARVNLHLMWAPHGRVEWSDVAMTAIEPPKRRIVRLATVHLCPTAGKNPDRNCRLFEPLIAKAAQQHADLVVLPETLTYYGTGKEPADVAETIPGPSTKYFGDLARKHDLYIVAGLFERADHLVYNVAVLIGPHGEVVGKYRKVTLPTGEIELGVAAGDDYPVFRTRFGTVGMMICYDGFFPEVARELSNRGAEVIAWPVWGCNPDLARARATENHVYVVSSTYTDIARNWMISAIYDRTGDVLSQATQWGTVAVSTVDLSQATRWRCMGDFKARIERHRPKLTIARP